MRREGLNYVVVGSFVLLMVALLMVSLYLITGRAGPAEPYHVYYENVTGLKFGTNVFYEGYQIGQVEDISPQRTEQGMRFRVDISVAQGWKIPQDSVARMVASGLLSAITIDISEGQSESHLEPGQEIAGEGGADIFTVINQVALDLNQLAETSLRPLLNNLNGALGTMTEQLEETGPGLLRDLRDLVASLNQSAQGLNELLSEQSRSDIRSIIADMKVTAGNAVQVSETAIAIADDARVAAANVARMSADLERTRARVDALMAQLHSAVSDNRPDVERALRSLREALDVVSQHAETVAYHMEGTSRNMHEFSRQIRQNPGLLLGGKPPPDRQAVQP